jgi:hypothetical protein
MLLILLLWCVCIHQVYLALLLLLWRPAKAGLEVTRPGRRTPGGTLGGREQVRGGFRGFRG